LVICAVLSIRIFINDGLFLGFTEYEGVVSSGGLPESSKAVSPGGVPDLNYLSPGWAADAAAIELRRFSNGEPFNEYCLSSVNVFLGYCIDVLENDYILQDHEGIPASVYLKGFGLLLDLDLLLPGRALEIARRHFGLIDKVLAGGGVDLSILEETIVFLDEASDRSLSLCQKGL